MQLARSKLAVVTMRLLLAIGLCFPFSSAALAADLSQGPPFPIAPRGQAAIDALANRLPAVAQAYGLTPNHLKQLFLTDSTLSVDAGGELFYVDLPYPDDAGQSAQEMAAQPAAEIEALALPALSSLPGAAHTIYLDFDGHVTTGTTWNSAYGVSTINSPAYSLDGDPAFNATEIARIQTVWEWVAEDFKPFQVNVTTIDPGPAALSRSGGGDGNWGVRVVITSDTFANCGCGGHAYIGSFDDSVDEPVFVYNSSLKGVSEASSHEVGHSMNLAHDGTSAVTYYYGHGSGTTSWGPLMGASYSVNVSQWSKGDYFDANNNTSSANYGNGPDDLAVITSLTNGNGFGYRPDDHGGTSGSATPLAVSGTSVGGSGIVERTLDTDTFRFTTGAGAVSISVLPASPGANLDIIATVKTANDILIATADPASTLSASFNLNLTAGEYFLHIQGTGTGNPLSSTPTGYTNYGSLGAYQISGTVQPGGSDTTPPAAPTGLNATGGNGSVGLTWAANGEGDLAGYTVYRSTTNGSGYAALTSVQAATTYNDSAVTNGTTYYYVVTASDTSANQSTNSNQASATPTAPPDTTPPAAPTGLNATGGNGTVGLTWVANGESDLAGYTVYRSTTNGSGYAALTGVQAATTYNDNAVTNGTTYYYVVTASDTSANQSSNSNQASATPAGGTSRDLATSDYQTLAGSVSGSYVNTHAQDTAYQNLTEAHAGGRPADRYDQAGQIWTFSVTNGNHIFWVDAYYTDAGDADTGFVFEWSQNPGGQWNYLLAIENTDNNGGYATVDMGSPTGTIYVRAHDTNQTSGQNNNDTLHVNHMFIAGGAPPTNPPAPAANPDPGAGATGVSLTPTLSWTAGLGAQSHRVYLGTTSPPTTLVADQIETSFTSGVPLAQTTTYYWRVDEVNSVGTTPGTVWSFTTQGTSTTASVQSIVLSTASAARGEKYAQAIVTIVDNFGNPVSGATVTGTFTGTPAQTNVAAVTGSNGQAVLTTSTSAKKPSFQFCVTGIASSLAQGSLGSCQTYP